MKIRPFLSHKRSAAADVARLRKTLRVYGAGGWKDTEDLRLGARTDDELRRVIKEETGGFIWWGTRDALMSRTINAVEIPTALDRADVGDYAVVPIFIELHPVADRSLFDNAFVRSEDFLGWNGLSPRAGERPAALRRRIAERYVTDSVARLPSGAISVAFRVFSEPHQGADVTFDWRDIFDVGQRAFRVGGLSDAQAALRNFRDSLQQREHAPRVEIDSELPLPMAYMLGYEWRQTTRLRLMVQQRTGATFAHISAAGVADEPPAPLIESYKSSGPVVVAASCGSEMTMAAARYAHEVGASELRMLHVDGMLGHAALRGLARAAAGQLRFLRDRKAPKHLLILGPSALAIFIGAESNAVGPVQVPFWRNATMDYANAIVVGGNV